MTAERHAQLIHELAAGLKPVRRLPSPPLRALVWLAVVAAVAIGLAAFANVLAVWQRIAAAPDLWLAVAGSSLTAILAAVAAFELSVPDRARRWAILPIPGLLLWIGASGVGCLRSWVVPDTHVATLSDTRSCIIFILALSVPLSVLLVVMLRRACPLHPGLTAATGGLAVAAAAATLLNLFHPYDAAATDLVVHAFAVALVVAVNHALAGRLLGGPPSHPPDVTTSKAGSI